MGRDHHTLAVAMSLFMAAAYGAQPPTFTAESVLPANSALQTPLAPGLVMSIYGHGLGPASPCEGHAEPNRREAPNPARPVQGFLETLIYPTEVCGVRVLVGDLPAGLLYVSERQINFKVPQGVAVSGAAPVRVIYNGVASAPVLKPLGIELIQLSLAGAAYVGMPVWVKASAPIEWMPLTYPFGDAPTDFGCNDIEVRRGSVPVNRRTDTAGTPPRVGAGLMCGVIGVRGRRGLPLHILYQFDRPGSYDVRVTSHGPDGLIRAQSAWTSIRVQPTPLGEPARWLRAQAARMPQDPAEVLGDFLPSLVGMADTEALKITAEYLYHPNELVRWYALGALTCRPKEESRKYVLPLLRSRGPTDVVSRALAADDREALVRSSIQFLRSDSPLTLRGAVDGIGTAFWEKSPVSAELRHEAVTALLGAREHVLRVGDPQTITFYASFLGGSNDPRARAVLWDFIDRRTPDAFEQALIAMTWFKNPADLPKLGAMLLTPANGDPLRRDLSSLPYALHRAYGDAALRYLEAAVAKAELTWVRTQSARELVLANRPSGFRFVVDGIENNRQYRREMTEFIRQEYPHLRTADDASVLAFVKGKANP